MERCRGQKEVEGQKRRHGQIEASDRKYVSAKINKKYGNKEILYICIFIRTI